MRCVPLIRKNFSDMFSTELGDFPGVLIARCVDNINPYTDKPEEGLEVGKDYEVRSISMGQSHTTVYLKDRPKGYNWGYNSIYFKFYEDGKKVNIYKNKKFNPYL